VRRVLCRAAPRRGVQHNVLPAPACLHACVGVQAVGRGLDRAGRLPVASLQVSDPPAKEEEAIRGFRVIKQETASYEITAPGEFTLPAVPAPAAV
jgi:hypothetical protein